MKRAIVFFFVSLFISLPLCVLAVGFFDSQRLETAFFTYDADLGQTLKVTHLSDLHYPKYGVAPEKILQEAESFSPDLVFLTGDLFDGAATEEDLSSAEPFFSALSSLADAYAVVGNHEIGSPLYDKIRVLFKKTGVTLLENRSVRINHGGNTVLVCGVKDACLPTEKNLIAADLPDESDVLSLLLAHRPEYFSDYALAGFSYCFSGHVHGGQVRIGKCGLLSPDRGWFPVYSSGAYTFGDSTLLVSRGLGDGKSNFRIFNPYHIINVTFL